MGAVALVTPKALALMRRLGAVLDAGGVAVAKLAQGLARLVGHARVGQAAVDGPGQCVLTDGSFARSSVSSLPNIALALALSQHPVAVVGVACN